MSEPGTSKSESWSDVVRGAGAGNGEGAGANGKGPGAASGKGGRRARGRLLALAAGIAILAVGAVVAVTQTTGGGTSSANLALFKDIPQRDLQLGDPRAPVVVTEFADFQCPICAAWARDELPTVIEKYVRTGKVLLVFQGLHFLDRNFGTTDSEQALRLALASANQGHLWEVADLIFHKQGREGSGWATPALLKSIVSDVPGLDAERALADRNTVNIDHWMETADEFATRSGVQGTPSFLFRKGKKQGLYPQYADAATFGKLVATVMKQ